MKALTFEEWMSRHIDMKWRDTFDLARQGMIPEDEAVRIPPVSEWPSGASGVSVLYVSEGSIKPGCAAWEPYCGDGDSALIKFFPRHVPAWTPKVGDAVFANDEDSGYVIAMKVHDIDKDGLCEMFDHFGTWWHHTHLKPFDASKIGLPWDQI